ncbi:hypothetical protein B0T24DRAFT_422253 [Lasiosphaeria ovina]|uniref:Uncharacterized protein n=1 Tax=Lasiosphaeria ovina TaxID=92902 RepID=A0AAE0JWM7_9PEZI|nr:hypothetical protein B0T24DRAFT_422253 [Lasiosphaeria ovina]
MSWHPYFFRVSLFFLLVFLFAHTFSHFLLSVPFLYSILCIFSLLFPLSTCRSALIDLLSYSFLGQFPYCLYSLCCYIRFLEGKYRTVKLNCDERICVGDDEDQRKGKKKFLESTNIVTIAAKSYHGRESARWWFTKPARTINYCI